MDEKLIGYCLNLLDDETQQEMEEYLRRHPEAQQRVHRLRKALAPLASDSLEDSPPPDLVTRTLGCIAEYRCQKLPMAPRVSPRQPMRQGWWRRPDFLAASILILSLVAVGVPFVFRSRHQAGVLRCADNLRNFHHALVDYADHNERREFPMIQENGACSFAGSFIPLLHDAGMLDERLMTNCTNEGGSPPRRLTTRQLKDCYDHRRSEYDHLTHELGGNYAYSLGYRQGGGLHGLSRAHDGYLPIMADRPPFYGCEPPVLEKNSPNHGGQGQNVLSVDGSVSFRKTRFVNGDDIYLNRNQKICAGQDERDSVLGASDAKPAP